MSRKHTLLALLVVLLWGVNFVVIDAGLADVPPLLFLALRFVLVAIPAVFLVPRPAIGWRSIVMIGAFLSLGQFSLLYVALALGMPPGIASLVLQVQIVLTVLLSAIVLHERPTRRQVVGLGVGLAGLVVVALAHGARAPWLPFVVTVGAALSWSIGNVLSRRAGSASGLGMVVWSGLVVPLPALALSLVVDGPEAVGAALAGLSGAAILSTAYTAVFASLLGYGIWSSLLGRYPSARVVPFALLIPVVGVLAAWVFQGEQPSTGELVGGAVMVAGLFVATVRFGRAPA